MGASLEYTEPGTDTSLELSPDIAKLVTGDKARGLSFNPLAPITTQAVPPVAPLAPQPEAQQNNLYPRANLGPDVKFNSQGVPYNPEYVTGGKYGSTDPSIRIPARPSWEQQSPVVPQAPMPTPGGTPAGPNKNFVTPASAPGYFTTGGAAGIGVGTTQSSTDQPVPEASEAGRYAEPTGYGSGLRPPSGGMPGGLGQPMAPVQTMEDIEKLFHPKLYDTIVGMETGGEKNPDTAVSPKGAVGKHQIMPTTAQPYLQQITGKPVSEDEARQLLLDPAMNRQVFDAHMRDLKQRYAYLADEGTRNQAILVAYHDGMATADLWLARGKDISILGPEGRKYLTAGSKALGIPIASVEPGSIPMPTRPMPGVGGQVQRQTDRYMQQNPIGPIVTPPTGGTDEKTQLADKAVDVSNKWANLAQYAALMQALKSGQVKAVAVPYDPFKNVAPPPQPEQYRVSIGSSELPRLPEGDRQLQRISGGQQPLPKPQVERRGPSYGYYQG